MRSPGAGWSELHGVAATEISATYSQLQWLHAQTGLVLGLALVLQCHALMQEVDLAVSGLRPLLVVLSLAYLLGLLAVDAVIDTADSPVAFFHYYCVLLDSLTAWPQVRAKHISFLLGSALGPLTV